MYGYLDPRTWHTRKEPQQQTPPIGRRAPEAETLIQLN